jgi:hypothetical protein
MMLKRILRKNGIGRSTRRLLASLGRVETHPEEEWDRKTENALRRRNGIGSTLAIFGALVEEQG